MLVEMRDICKDYPQGKDFVHILKNINLEVAEGITLRSWVRPARERRR